jgi:hypothetical protein
MRLLLLFLFAILITACAWIPGPGPAPTPTRSPITLSVEPDEIDRGETITIRWDAPGAESVTLDLIAHAEWKAVTRVGADLPPAGTLTATIPVERVYLTGASVQLSARLPGGDGASATAGVSVRCPYTYFWGAEVARFSCPLDAPQETDALWQPFAGGYMLWRADTNEVTALYEQDHFTQVFPDTSPVTLAEDPPPGRFAPDPHFAGVWTGDTRELLAWATAPAQPYTMRWQVYVENLRYVMFDKLYFTLPDGGLAYFYGPMWTLVDD